VHSPSREDAEARNCPKGPPALASQEPVADDRSVEPSAAGTRNARGGFGEADGPEAWDGDGVIGQRSAQTHGTDEDVAQRGPGEQRPSLKARAIDEGKKFLIMTLYLWVFLSVLDLHKTAILRENHINYEAQGLAIVNAMVFAKVMLVADGLKLGARFGDRPLIYSVLYSSFLFAVALIGFHIAEGAALALLHGRPVADSLADLGAGDPRVVLSFGAIAFVALIPFFLFRGIARAVGEEQLLHLVLTRGKGAALPPG